MARPTEQIAVPDSGRPEYLRGLKLPATTDDAIAYAQEHGAPAKVLEFMEKLPSAVFTSETGLHHAFAGLRPEDLELPEPEHATAHDGVSS